jgi:hypothetical protein
MNYKRSNPMDKRHALAPPARAGVRRHAEQVSNLAEMCGTPQSGSLDKKETRLFEPGLFSNEMKLAAKNVAKKERSK